MKDWEIIGDNLSKAGWNCGCISSTDREGRQFWVVAAECKDAERFIVHASLGGSENSTKLIYLLLGLRFIRLRAR
jgi:hypothetical protein